MGLVHLRSKPRVALFPPGHAHVSACQCGAGDRRAQPLQRRRYSDGEMPSLRLNITLNALAVS